MGLKGECLKIWGYGGQSKAGYVTLSYYILMFVEIGSGKAINNFIFI